METWVERKKNWTSSTGEANLELTWIRLYLNDSMRGFSVYASLKWYISGWFYAEVSKRELEKKKSLEVYQSSEGEKIKNCHKETPI